jgi:hypothetical protein
MTIRSTLRSWSRLCRAGEHWFVSEAGREEDRETFDSVPDAEGLFVQVLSDWGMGEIELHAVFPADKAAMPVHEHSSTGSSSSSQETMGSRWGGYSACEVSDNAQLSTPWQEVISFFLRGGDVAEDVAGSLGTGWHAVRRSAGR